MVEFSRPVERKAYIRVVAVIWCFTPSQPLRLYHGDLYQGDSKESNHVEDKQP